MVILSTVIEKIDTAFRYTLILLMIEITVVITVAVLGRYFFNKPLYWAEEVTRYSFVWATFLGAACAYKRRELVAMSVFFNMLPASGRRWLLLLIEVLMSCFLLLAAFFGVKMVQVVAPQLSVATRVSMSYLYVVIPLSCGFMLLCGIQNITSLIQERKLFKAWGENF